MSKTRKLPVGWSEFEFGNVAEIQKGKYVPNENENYRCLELEHFNQGTGTILGWVKSSEQKSTKNQFKKGQVLFGKLRPYLQKYWLAEFDGVCSSEVWVLTCKDKKCSNEYLFRLIQHHHFIQVANVSSGSKMPRADWGYVSSFPFPFPPHDEQQKIAKFLSSIDEVINTNLKLISKKEKNKKWLMQQLLTGKKRLKGFEEEWKDCKLNFYIESFTEKPKKEIKYEILTSSKSGLMKQSDYYTGNRLIEREETDYHILPPDFITYRSRSDDGIFKFNKNTLGIFGLISGYYPVFTIKNGDPDFILMFLNFYCYKLRKYSIGTSQLVLSIAALKSANFKFPTEKEQIAISKILTSADKEIRLLKEKVEKLKEQKKGLMQVLLTGKKRLKID